MFTADSSRVRITADEFHSDYVCAAYVNVRIKGVYFKFSQVHNQGYRQEKVFMAAENPMDTTMIEFWTMVWEKKCHAIVMLSLLEENEVVSM